MKLKSIATTAFATLAMATAQSAPIVTFTPSSTQIAVGGTVNIDIYISGLDDEVLSAYDLNLLWDPGVVHFTLFTQYLGQFGSSMFGFGDPDNTPVSQGNAGAWVNSMEEDDWLVANQDDSFLLFSIQMTGMADGATTLAFGPDADFQRLFIGLNAEVLDVQLGSACIAVGNGSCDNRVPEPAGYGLAAIALLGAGWARRQRKAD